MNNFHIQLCTFHTEPHFIVRYTLETLLTFRLPINIFLRMDLIPSKTYPLLLPKLQFDEAF